MDRNVLIIIIVILWSVLSGVGASNYLPRCRQLKGLEFFYTYIILMIGGPFFAIAQLLDLMLPEVDDEEDDDDFKKY